MSVIFINPYRFRRLWTPAQLTTALWLDAADSSSVTQSSGLISQVNDKSGNSRNFTASSGDRPTYTTNGLNGLPVFTFGGTQFLTSASTASTWNFLHNTTGSTVITVWKAGNSSDPNTAYMLCGTNAGTTINTGLALFYDDRVSVLRNNCAVSLITRGFVNFPAANNVSNDAHPVNQAVILCHRGDPGNGTASNRSIFNINGGLDIANNAATDAASTGDATFTLQVGASGTGAALLPLTGYIAEFLVFNSVLSTTNRQLVEGYLAHKWGTASSLPSDHPYKNAPPTI